MRAEGPGGGPDIDQGRGRDTSQSLIRRSRRVLLALVFVLVAGGAGTAAAVFDDSGGASRADDPISRTAATSTSTTSLAPTTTAPATTAPPGTTLPPGPTLPTLPAATSVGVLPQPAPSPLEAYANVPVTQVGEVSIPKIGLHTPYYEGVWLTVIDVGPGHWPGTASAGGYGNMVLAGHRVSHSHPFRNIDQLAPGDPIFVRDATGIYTYKVTSTEVVTPDSLWIVDQKPGHDITLFACHPPGSATYRFVVHGSLVSAPRAVN
jgi:sortase A